MSMSPELTIKKKGSGDFKSPNSVRLLALQILNQILAKKKFASLQIDQNLKNHSLGARDKALLTTLIYGVLRNKLALDHFLAELIRLEKTPGLILNILRIAAFQILCLDRVPDYAVLFESVEIAKMTKGKGAGKLVNAVLRGIQKQRGEFLRQWTQRKNEFKKNSSLKQQEVRELAWVYSVPPWLLNRWMKRYPYKDLLGNLEYLSGLPPLYLRMNEKKITSQRFLTNIAEMKASVKKFEDKIFFTEGVPRKTLDDWVMSGRVSIQDRGSYRVVQVLDPKIHESGLDACAGHGGKTSAIAEALGEVYHLYVHDPSQKKLSELKENFLRLGLAQPQTLRGLGQAKKKGLKFDWILVDAPCSGLGTLGRRPEIRYRVRKEDFAIHQKKQLGILKEWGTFLKKGGRLLYSVCSLEPEEGEEVIKKFIREFPGWREDKSFTWLPSQEKHDGFFVSRLIK